MTSSPPAIWTDDTYHLAIYMDCESPPRFRLTGYPFGLINTFTSLDLAIAYAKDEFMVS